MIDNIKAEFESDIFNDFKPEDFYKPFHQFGIDFYPKYNRQGKYSHHIGSYKRLSIKAYLNCIKIENSLHKFSKGNNYSQFTKSEIVSVIEELEEVFGIPSYLIKVKKLEVGINIETSVSFYSLFNQYKSNKFESMRHGKKVYGSKSFMTEFNIKGYNKKNQTQLMYRDYRYLDLSDNLQRFEMEFKSMRPLKGLVTKLSDLKNANTLKELGNMLLCYYDSILFKDNYDFSTLTPRKRELVYAGMNDEFWETEKINMNTRKKKRTMFNKIIKELEANSDKNQKAEVRHIMFDNINFLIEN